ncbi:Putative nuclease HARBI1 [Linum grandiflorum]
MIQGYLVMRWLGLMGLKSVEGYITWVTLDTEILRGVLVAFRRQQYHLNEWGTRRPNTPAEYYNMKHSSARNVIERTFGVLKKKWAILRNTTWFSPNLVAQIVNACCLLQNYILRKQRRHTHPSGLIELDPLIVPANHVDQVIDFITSTQPTPQWNQFSLQKAQEMWQNRIQQ